MEKIVQFFDRHDVGVGVRIALGVGIVIAGIDGSVLLFYVGMAVYALFSAWKSKRDRECITDLEEHRDAAAAAYREAVVADNNRLMLKDAENRRLTSVVEILQWCRLHEGEMNRWSHKLPPEVADAYKRFAAPKGDETIDVLERLRGDITTFDRCLNGYRGLWEQEEEALQKRAKSLTYEHSELLRFFIRRAFVAPQWVHHLRSDKGIKGSKDAEASVGQVQDLLTAQALGKLGELIRLERELGTRVWAWSDFKSVVQIDTGHNQLLLIEELQDHRPNGPDSYGSGISSLPSDLELTLHRAMRTRPVASVG